MRSCCLTSAAKAVRARFPAPARSSSPRHVPQTRARQAPEGSDGIFRAGLSKSIDIIYPLAHANDVYHRVLLCRRTCNFGEAARPGEMPNLWTSCSSRLSAGRAELVHEARHCGNGAAVSAVSGALGHLRLGTDSERTGAEEAHQHRMPHLRPRVRHQVHRCSLSLGPRVSLGHTWCSGVCNGQGDSQATLC